MLGVYYIFHSGFAVTTGEVNLIFDYWKDLEGKDAEGMPEFFKFLNVKLPTCVFVSHFHKDHFNPEIFAWSQWCPDIHYVISKDTARHGRKYIKPDSLFKGPKAPDNSVTILKKGETYQWKGIEVKAFGSSDEGLSYHVMAQGESIFHAGDLNWWGWGDDTPQEAEESRRLFMDVMKEIESDFGRDTGKHLDLLLFPVDPRLGGDFWKGATYFMEKTETTLFMPMHYTLAEYPLTPEDYRKQVEQLISEGKFRCRTATIATVFRKN